MNIAPESIFTKLPIEQIKMRSNRERLADTLCVFLKFPGGKMIGIRHVLVQKKRPPFWESASHFLISSCSRVQHWPKLIPIHQHTALIAIRTQAAGDHLNRHIHSDLLTA